MAKKREAEETTAVAEHQREYAPPRELFSSFAKRHGNYIVIGEAVETRPGIWNHSLLFEDGATARSTDNIGHGGQDPNPMDIVGRGRLQLRYAEEKLNQELKAYDRYRTQCMEQADHHLKFPQACPPPPANMDETLTAGEQRIDRWQKRVAELNEILNKLDPQRVEKRLRAASDLKAAEERQATYDQAMARLSQVPNIAPMQETDDTFTPAEETEA